MATLISAMFFLLVIPALVGFFYSYLAFGMFVTRLLSGSVSGIPLYIVSQVGFLALIAPVLLSIVQLRQSGGEGIGNLAMLALFLGLAVTGIWSIKMGKWR
jgi:hypothetical protein